MSRRRPDPHRSRCAMCDYWYDDRDAEEVDIHRHPEPQSLEPRDAWMASGLPYRRWITETAEGRAWLAENPERNRA